MALDPAPATAFYKLKARALSGTAIQLSFTGVPGRDPEVAGDYVALWQNREGVPWGAEPLATEAIKLPGPDGSWVFRSLSLTSLPYVVAYSVGASAAGHEIAAVVPLGVGGEPGQPQAITLNTCAVEPTSLALAYATPIGVAPLSFGHRVVLVEGQSFGSATPVVAEALPSEEESDIAAFNGVTMVKGQWYTGAYLTGSSAESVAATVSFQVQAT